MNSFQRSSPPESKLAVTYTDNLSEFTQQLAKICRGIMTSLPHIDPKRMESPAEDGPESSYVQPVVDLVRIWLKTSVDVFSEKKMMDKDLANETTSLNAVLRGLTILKMLDIVSDVRLLITTYTPEQ